MDQFNINQRIWLQNIIDNCYTSRLTNKFQVVVFSISFSLNENKILYWSSFYCIGLKNEG